MARYKLAAYWGPRAEPIQQCVDRLQYLLSALARENKIFGTWHETSHTREAAIRANVALNSRERLQQILEKGRGGVSEDPERVKKLGSIGFTCNLWNGRTDDESVTLSFQCSCTVPRLWNLVVIELPRRLGGLAAAEEMSRILVPVVRCSDPDWAEVFTVWIGPSDPGKPIPAENIDWIVYLSQRCFSVPRTEAPGEIAKLDDRGWIVVMQPEAPDTENDEYRKRAVRMRESFGLRGLPCD